MPDNSHAITNATGWLASIGEMLTKLDAADEGEQIECPKCEGEGETAEGVECPECGGLGSIDNPNDEESIRQEIHESPLSLQVRGGWYQPGDVDKGGSAEEYEILLSTGGPALRIVGELGLWAEPDTARLQWQDWGTPWTDHDTTTDEDAALLRYARQFYFGEG